MTDPAALVEVDGSPPSRADSAECSPLGEPAEPSAQRRKRVCREGHERDVRQLVGANRRPEPEQVELAALYRPEHRFRLSLRPGMTGPMQIFGRGNLSFEERLSLEREYIENLSLGRDLRILAMTIPAVVLGRGAF